MTKIWFIHTDCIDGIAVDYVVVNAFMESNNEFELHLNENGEGIIYNELGDVYATEEEAERALCAILKNIKMLSTIQKYKEKYPEEFV